MSALATKDPSKGFGAGTLFTKDPSKGFGMGLLFKKDSDPALMGEEERKKQMGVAPVGMKKGGAASASRRADGIAQRGKTRGKMV